MQRAVRTCTTTVAQQQRRVLSKSRIMNLQNEESSRPETAGFWFQELVTPTFSTSVRLRKIMHQSKSEFQDMSVIETADFGKTLVLDDKTQSAQKDEKIYHESLVHPAMLAHKCPRTVYIGGGGELATAREVLRHPCVEKVVMVDLDKAVVDVSAELLPEWGDGCLDDPRLELHYTDAKAFLENWEGKPFDVIIMDIADPIEAGPGVMLYTVDFYKNMKNKMAPGAVFTTQSASAGLLAHDECFTVINRTLREVFDNVFPSSVEIPSFGANWGFHVAYDNTADEQLKPVSPLEVLPEEFDARIEERKLEAKRPLYFLDGVSHRGIFGVAKWLRKACAAEERIMTAENPIYFF
ncbi:MAG: hypothetical protein MHM6MM_001200 [Cercozoa sp. M6MM]